MTDVVSSGPTVVERLRAVLRNPLYRSGHALMLNAALTAGVGIGFWLVAARFYPPAVVGRNSAAISAMMFLAGMAQLNLMSALLRFVPTAGARAPRLVLGSYALGAATSAVVATVFVAGIDRWAPDLEPLLADRVSMVWFVVATAAWAIFVMQDPVLVAVRRSWMVPTENLVFALLKLALVFAVATVLPAVGILVSWTVAMTLAVVGTTAYILGRALPAHVRAAPDAVESPGVPEIARFTAADYVGALFWVAATALMPVLVLDLAGATSAAAFAMAWTITLALYQLPTGMGQSLVTHAASDQAHLGAHHRDALKHTLRLVVPAVAVLAISAPWILEVFGSVYADEGTTVLRLLALSAVPHTVNSMAVSRGRVQRHMRFVVTLLAILCSLVLALAVVLLPVLGIVGVGVAWLVAQSLVAAFLLVRERR
jgi:O-antigen/teichoic acid export membrane protein